MSKNAIFIGYLLGFSLLTMITLAAGTTFIMWLGEQITERGIGNGISLIISVGIISRLPSAARFTYQTFFGREVGIKMHPIVLIIMLIILVAVVAAVIQLTVGQRKIPVQYAKRIVGRKVYGADHHQPPAIESWRMDAWAGCRS